MATTPTVSTKDTTVISTLTTDRISSSSTQDINNSTTAALTYPTDFPPVPPTQGLYTTDTEETDVTVSNETSIQDIDDSTMATTPAVTTKDTTVISTLTTDRISSSSSTQDIGESTMATECQPGYYKPTLQVEWTHVLDTAGSMESYKDVIAEALSLVSIDLIKFVGSDNATFSLIETADKTRVCTAQDVALCECHGELFREESFRQLNCTKHGHCALWDATLDR